MVSPLSEEVVIEWQLADMAAEGAGVANPQFTCGSILGNDALGALLPHLIQRMQLQFRSQRLLKSHESHGVSRRKWADSKT